MIIPDFSKLRGANATEKGINKNYPEFYKYIIDNYPTDLSFTEKIYWYNHNLTTYPVCLNCGNRVKFAGSKRGYYQYCSLKCSNNSSEVKKKKESSLIDKFESIVASYESRIQKTKQTLIDRYGSVEASYNSRLQKIKDTNLERYGVECSFQSEEVKEKVKQTLIDRYGSVEASYNSRLQKIKDTNLERYGVEHYNNYEKVRQTKLERYKDADYNNLEKIKRTCLERYGVECSFQSEEVKEKAKRTCLERYGASYPMQNQEILLKAMNVKKKNIINGHKDILDVKFENEQTNYVCSCPHEKCTKCTSKTYTCNSICYFNRRYRGLEVCTKLLPVKKSHSQKTSLELFITNILDEYNIEYITNNRDILNNKELDIYIPSKNIAIECNGCFWHSTFNKSNNYHVQKFDECLSKGIQLLTLWEDQIIKTSKIVESILLSKLGIYKEKIYARKCIIKEVSSEESSIFLNENHLQGNTHSSIKLGLYYNEELVSIMTFGVHRTLLNNKQKDNSYELYRFCNKLNTVVVGGASKLLNYFINIYKPNQITSFASKDISCGNIYENLGFTKSGNSLSYWYIDSKTLNRYHRYKFRKSELLKMGYDNELDFLKNEKYLKIFDSGQLKFTMNIK